MYMATRSLDQLIGFAGGIVGIVLGAIGLLLSNFGLIHGSNAVTMILFSLIGILGAYLVTSRKKDGGMIMLVIGIAGIIALPNPYIVAPFVILLVAGAIARF